MASGVCRNGSHRASLKVDRSSTAISSIRPYSFKSKLPPASNIRRSSPGSLGPGTLTDNDVSARVRVAVRLRPRNAEELIADADFGDCVELQPELKRLKLRKNNWVADTYEFDEVLTEFSSQKRTYEVVAKPVVESVLGGYNGTVMAYGQTGTGKTFTLGQLGDGDGSSRGIMVRSMEDILSDICLDSDTVSVAYLQLYMETVQDLIDPSNDNISIVEDPRTGDVSVPGATLVEIREQKCFVDLLHLGEAHRFAANTKLNTESSRSHAILMVHVMKSAREMETDPHSENGINTYTVRSYKPTVLRKSKLVVVDLAGSERIHKSGSEGHTLEEAKFINLSLSALGKCINALAENNSHVPVRDSKLTRLLKDSFGGSARTSLVVTIGPSPRHRGETTSTILFGQRAMKVENMLKIKEEFDYKCLSRKLEVQLEKLIAENERQQKEFENELGRINLMAEKHINEAESKFANALEEERVKCQVEYMESIKKLEEKWTIKRISHGSEEHANLASPGQALLGPISEDIAALKSLLNNEAQLRKSAEEEVKRLRSKVGEYIPSEKVGENPEIVKLREMLESEGQQKRKFEDEIMNLRGQVSKLTFEIEQARGHPDKSASADAFTTLDSLMIPVRHSQFHGGIGQKTSVAKLFEQVGLQKILSLLESQDSGVRIHAVKVVANLAAEEANQVRIVEAGGLSSLLILLKRSEDESLRRVAAGAIANLAMSEANQELIMAEGGISLLSSTATEAEDPQTLRMVAGAIANLCGNDKLQMKLKSEGGIKALLGIVRCRHSDVLSQVARGIANFAKCESRASAQGMKSGRSHLIEDGALPWIVQNANNEASPIRRHIELALCHLAQHEANAKDMIAGGALWELIRISRDCSRDDIRSLARRTLKSSPTLLAELRRLHIDC